MAGAGARGLMPAGPIIVTALFGAADFVWLDALRRAHFPADRNQVPAHLTLFHHLPPSLENELDRRLASEARGSPPPRAEIGGLVKLGRGVAYRIDCPELADIRARIADAFTTMLTPQDRAPWRAHVTIQNKVEPAVAAALHARLTEDFVRRAIAIEGLATWRYLGGPWQALGHYPFSRSGRARRS